MQNVSNSPAGTDVIVPKNDRLLKALRREPVDCTPIWLMRQAGRYLPEYKELRSKAGDFLSLCKNTEFATEVTLQPLRRFELDAAILFSDILTIPDAMGLGLYFATGEGPKFKTALQSEALIQAIEKPPQGSLDYVYAAVKSISKALNNDVPLLGFSGTPWTLAAYMIEGGASKDFRHIKQMLFQTPELLHHLLGLLADVIVDYLHEQVKAGVHAVQLFDSWGGLLSDTDYEPFSLAYSERIVRALKARVDVPVILFTKHGGQWLERMAAIGVDGLSLDWLTSLPQAQKRVGDQVALQGNLDPYVLLGDPQVAVSEATKLLESLHSHQGHIFNLGHGISQFTNPDSVKALVDTVHGFKVG